MSCETPIHRARELLDVERDALDAKLGALDRFVTVVSDLPAETDHSPSLGTTATAGTHAQGGTDSERCRTVRTAFAETIRPHSVADVDAAEDVLTTIRHEFTESIAVALAPTTQTAFTTELKRAVLSEADDRRAETATMHRALDRETAQLTDAVATVDEVTTWLVEEDSTPLSAVGFERLHQRHRTLAAYRQRCECRLRERQSFLQTRTNGALGVGVHHQRLVSYLYSGFSTSDPVLTTLTRLDATWSRCQRAVRDHLVRRV